MNLTKDRLSIIRGKSVMMVLLLLAGLAYLFIAPKEANYHFGYRCFFGMGSEEAWQFTQRLAGIVWAALGLVLTVVMLFITGGFGSRDVMEVIGTGVKCLLWEAGLTALSCLAINVTVAVRYDRRGNRRGM